ncbi:hypothetical protein E2C01_081385 [Portunus trituberculatus]|uniref:Uncharacterized protein n=1 Tax=Portunus trituberculatus TaxID=210409 RepID=A0A5B7IW69_PORTR|nr:hypothetical protein [Portunus trituberculatus]
MQAALLVRNNRRKRGKVKPQALLGSLPPHVASQPIKPFPRYNPKKVSVTALRHCSRQPSPEEGIAGAGELTPAESMVGHDVPR